MVVDEPDCESSLADDITDIQDARVELTTAANTEGS